MMADWVDQWLQMGFRSEVVVEGKSRVRIVGPDISFVKQLLFVGV